MYSLHSYIPIFQTDFVYENLPPAQKSCEVSDQSDQLLVLNEGETQEPFYGNLGSLEPSQEIHDQIPDINTQSDPMVSAPFSFNVYNTVNHIIQIFQTKTQNSVYENLAPAQKSCEVSDQILDLEEVDPSSLQSSQENHDQIPDINTQSAMMVSASFQFHLIQFISFQSISYRFISIHFNFRMRCLI